MFRFERGLLGLSAILILAVLAIASVGFAQTGTTSLRGAILDSSGAVIAGATVTLSNSQTGFERSVVTEETGTYEFLGLTPGVYSLRVEKENFRKHEITKIELQVNTPKAENVTLDVGSSTQTVEVAASTQVLNTTDASLGTAFNENQIKQLPLDGRNVPDLLTLQAGVVYTGNLKKQSEHGGFAWDDTNVMLLVSNPDIKARTVHSFVETAQVAPTILKLLGLDPDALDAVREEGTPILPGLDLDR